MTLPLHLVAERPDALDELSVPELAAIIAAASAKVLEKSAGERATLRPLLTLAEAAPLLGMNEDTLRKRARKDPAIRALTVDNGTTKVMFDVGKIEAFRKRRAG